MRPGLIARKCSEARANVQPRFSRPNYNQERIVRAVKGVCFAVEVAQRQREVEMRSDFGPREPARRYADHLQRTTLHEQAGADGGGTPPECTLPERIAQDDTGSGQPRKSSSDPSSLPEADETPGVAKNSPVTPITKAWRVPVPSPIRIFVYPLSQAKMSEKACWFARISWYIRADLLVQRIAEIVRAIKEAKMEFDLGQPMGFRHGQSTQANCIQQVEDRQIRADPKGECGDGSQSERQCLLVVPVEPRGSDRPW